MDITTVLGLVIGLGCMYTAVMADGGEFGLFFNIPAIVVVGGGTVAATCVHFPLNQVLKLLPVIKKTLFYRLPAEQSLIQKMVNYTAINRRDGALALEQQLPGAGDTFLVQALRMVIDGQNEHAIKDQLSMEIQYLQERHFDGKKILEFMGAGCPAFGMVGTLIGLVQMFSSMDDPKAIGKGMAAALVCTFYGAFLANLFFIPLAGKLGMRTKKEALVREMILEGTVGMVRGESPTAVRERMQAFVSVRHREDLKPKI
ncbi:MAG: MotA/TolQ/ExbB proton channel family protein [Phycisphaerae bacterium]|jgi:chemotaxis protein MotA